MARGMVGGDLARYGRGHGGDLLLDFDLIFFDDGRGNRTVNSLLCFLFWNKCCLFWLGHLLIRGIVRFFLLYERRIFVTSQILVGLRVVAALVPLLRVLGFFKVVRVFLVRLIVSIAIVSLILLVTSVAAALWFVPATALLLSAVTPVFVVVPVVVVITRRFLVLAIILRLPIIV